ncbi:putative PurR-regulated permease PerM [Isoptericola sp. CG 20/1183]|uniref:PurR-regulated permease PerM n=1 Tax=Isoptericola halotolerans TaxID=300560 RepID=A0ABX5EKI2_9MICO|nr:MULTISPECIES: AI-2E family transporter [Isoptericola]MCK0118532.1 AI-2E family transporter [Isoptericola sp. S6320L]PRZ04156.1 putative PurR-regulated permease PerM [Isoptericola sp. CG 20/1183]PRZ10019.1 putative PurR-regulated permease PerM [Isoptericola halotolerans]
MNSPHRTTSGLWSDRLGRPATRAAQVLLLLALASCVVFALTRLSLLVIPVLIALILAAALAPVVRFLRRHGWHPLLATWATLVGGLSLLGLVLWLVGREFGDEWSTLVGEAGRGLDELERFVTDGPLNISPEQLESLRQTATDALTSDAAQSGALRGATAAVEAVAGLFLGLVVLFFLLKDGRRIYTFLLTPLQEPTRERALRVGERSVDVLGGYLRGTAIVATVDAVAIGIGLLIIGVPLVLPLAATVFLGAFIPLIGAVLAGALAALVTLVTNGPLAALIVVGLVIAVNQLEGDLLAPVVMGHVLSLHPLAVLLALTAGTILAGLVGALLAVPIAAVGWAALKEWNATAPPGEKLVTTTPPADDA